LLREKGYRSVTIEGIAETAGVGKQTIYRWWPSKAAVILEAFARDTAVRVPAPDTGNLQRDLKIFLVKAFEILNRESGQIMRSLMSEALLDVEFAMTLREIFIDSRRHALRDILMRSIKRGEISPKVEIELMIDLIYGPMWYRLLNKHAPLDKEFAHHLSKTITVFLRQVP